MGSNIPTMPLGVIVHTWAATASHGTSIGRKGAIQAARLLVATGLDVLIDADLRQAARADFERRTHAKPYTPQLAPDMQHPLELPEWMLTGPVLR
jgi:aminobenzoyl-glutamate utilization protein B